MEKNIVDYLVKILSGKNGHLSLNSLQGHLAGLSQKERKYIKKLGGLEKLLNKYPDLFVVCSNDIYLIPKEENREENGLGDQKVKGEEKERFEKAPLDKKSLVDLESARDDPCTVCSDPIEIYAIGECRHPICYRCSTKLRDLCNDKNCPVCRQKLDMVVFSKRLLPIDEHDIDDYIKGDKNGDVFEDITIYRQKRSLLRHVCPQCPNVIFEDFMSLEAHMRDKHHLHYCDTCVKQCKIFTDERKTYTKSELEKHIKVGDNAGSMTGGHPLCQFCNYRYFDNDELLRHLRLHHCSCRICDQVNEEQCYHFYADKYELLEHQREKHYPCEHPDCAELDQIPVFKNEIDLRGHNLQCHIDQRNKMEKRSEKIINVPFVYERKKAKPKKILKVVPDAIGGITITGSVTGRIEKMYSFIERDDAPNQYSENVFFDVESCGLSPDDDLTEYFNPGDRVSAYALPVSNHHKSRWRAQKVEKLDEHPEEEDEAEEEWYPVLTARSQYLEESLQEFPSLATGSPLRQTSPALAGWSKLAQSAPVKPVVAAKPKPTVVSKPTYEIGFVHRNLMDKFGFIQKDKHSDVHEQNVYFNLEAYQQGMQQNVTNLKMVLEPGEKVCYILQDRPAYQNVQTKHRAHIVWKYSHNAKHVAPVDPDSYKVVSARPLPVPATGNVLGVDKMESLAEKYKRKFQSETKGFNLSQDSSASGGSQNDLGYVTKGVTATNVKKKKEPFTLNLSKHSREDCNNIGTALSLKGIRQVNDFLFKPVPDYNSASLTQQSHLAQVNTISSNSTSDNEARLLSSNAGSDAFSSDSDDSSSEEDSADDETAISDPNHSKFMDVLGICLNNKVIHKILKQQISKEMEEQGVSSTTHLQLIEFRKEDNSAHILFHIPQIKNSGDGSQVALGYAKLTGFYPLDSSWAVLLKSNRMATRVTKEFHQINGTCHYITVTKNKSERSKVMVHYRPRYQQG